MTNKDFEVKLHAEILSLISSYAPAEIEDVLFTAFSRANILSEGDFREDIETRESIHARLRSILKLLTAEHQNFKTTLEKWTNNITETT